MNTWTDPGVLAPHHVGRTQPTAPAGGYSSRPRSYRPKERPGMRNSKTILSRTARLLILAGLVMTAPVSSFGQNHNPEFKVSDSFLGGEPYIFIGDIDTDAYPLRTPVELKYRDGIEVPKEGTVTLQWVTTGGAEDGAVRVLANDSEDGTGGFTDGEDNTSVSGSWTWIDNDPDDGVDDLGDYENQTMYLQGVADTVDSNGNVTNSYAGHVVKLETSLSNNPEKFSKDFTLLKVEIGSQAEEAYKNKYVYRGDPLWNWAQNSRDLDNAYTGQTNDIASHPTLGDYVHYKAYHPGLDSSLVTNYKWSAVPAGGYTNLTTIDGPDDSSASEWKIEDGGVDWKSGIYEITLELTLSGGATATVTKEQTVWQRTDDVLVVGYIDSEDFPNIPDGATSQPVLADGTVSPVTMEDHLSPLNRTGFFGQVYIGVYKTVFKPDAARHYLNRFILQETANADPPSNFQLQLSNGVFVYDEVEINNFFSNNLNYRAINRLQAEYLLDESGEILAGPNVITKIAYQTNVGNTPDFPWVLESFADLVPFDWVDSSSEPEIHPDSGVFNFDDSTYDFYHVEHSIGVPQGFAQYVSGRVGAKGQGMNLKINGRETPWIYGLIEFKGDVYGPEYSEIIRQIFPTYWIYVNGERVNNFPQSDPELFIQLGNSL